MKRWSRAKVSRMLKVLEEQKYIKVLADTYGTHLTICNYELYQDHTRYLANTSETDVKQMRNRGENNSNKVKKGKKEYTCAKFNTFYEAYPKKKDKFDAYKIWQRLSPSLDLVAEIMSGLEGAKKSLDWIKEGGKYIPLPSTWLNKRRWEDNFEEIKRKPELAL
jgi:hypothetical protein